MLNAWLQTRDYQELIIYEKFVDKYQVTDSNENTI